MHELVQADNPQKETPGGGGGGGGGVRFDPPSVPQWREFGECTLYCCDDYTCVHWSNAIVVALSTG